MKCLVLLSCLSMISLFVQAQESPVAPDSLFIVTYTTGPSWDAKKSPGDQLYFKEHSTNLGTWRKEGLIKFGARYGDKGIIFISGATMSAVRERILNDPAVVNGLFLADIKKLSPFYYGCVEKTK